MSKKIYIFILVAMVFLSVTHLYAADANVLINPGFESGTSSWSGHGASIQSVSSPVNSGSLSGQAYNRDATWQGIRQDMLGKMVVGETYDISAWVRISGTNNDNVIASIKKTDDGGTSYQNVANVNAGDNSWNQLSGSYTLNVTGTLTELLVYFEGPASGVDIYVDDASVFGPEPGPISSTNQIDINTRHQTIEGFGAAGGWYESSLANHPNKTTLYNLLFRDLGLDIYRVRNAYDQGTDNYLVDSGRIVTAGQATLPRPLKVLISSWSPPAYLKSNGTTANGGTLIGGPGNYDYNGFANWWADSITAWSGYGVDADYISIQNEPDWSADWDTCLFDGTETATLAGYNLAFEAVWQELNSRMGASAPKMLFGESAGIPGSYKYLNNVIDLNHVYGHAHHLYNLNSGDSPDGYLTAMSDLKAQFGSKPLIQTEYEKATDAWPDALNMAHLLHNALTVEEVTAYIYWCLYWGNSGGLVSLTSSDYTINSDYYGFKHFSAFIHDGWQRVDVSDSTSSLKISAYINPNETQVSVVIVNTSASQAQADLSVAGFSISSGDVYRTSSTENCALVGSYDQPGAITIPASSVVTLSLNIDTGLTPPASPANFSAIANNASVTLLWNDNTEPDLDGYNIYRSTTAGTGYTKLNGSLLGTSDYTDNSVNNFTTYYYVVAAVDTDSNESSQSSEISAEPTAWSSMQPVAADFESGFGNWTNITGDDTHDWTRDSGGTTSSGTGPSSGAGGSTYYAYLECSANVSGASTAGDNAILESPVIAGTDRTLTFYYHMYGANIGSLNVDVFDGVWNNAIWSISGQQHTSSSDPYSQATVDLSPYTGSIQVRLRGVAIGGTAGDMAIDDVAVTGSSLNDYGDFTANGTVNNLDFAAFAGYWHQTNCGQLDLDANCVIDLRELAEMATNWLE